jgi:hypothetical protein
MVSRYPGPSIRAAFARRSCCARCRGAATASSNCSNSALLKVASFLGLRGRTSRPISCTFSTTSWRTRPTIVASCACWRASWGSGYQRTLREASGSGRSGHENERPQGACHRVRSLTGSLPAQVEHVRCPGPCERDIRERVPVDIAEREAVGGAFGVAERDVREPPPGPIVEKDCVRA